MKLFWLLCYIQTLKWFSIKSADKFTLSKSVSKQSSNIYFGFRFCGSRLISCRRYVSFRNWSLALYSFTGCSSVLPRYACWPAQWGTRTTPSTGPSSARTLPLAKPWERVFSEQEQLSFFSQVLSPSFTMFATLKPEKASNHTAPETLELGWEPINKPVSRWSSSRSSSSRNSLTYFWVTRFDIHGFRCSCW